MPFRLRLDRLLVFARRTLRLFLKTDSIEGPAYDASQGPVNESDSENHMILRPRQIAEQDIHQGDNSYDNADIKPPQNPVVDSNVKMHTLPNRRLTQMRFLVAGSGEQPVQPGEQKSAYEPVAETVQRSEEHFTNGSR